MGDVGSVPTMKRDASTPVMVIAPTVKSEVPVFCMVKVHTKLTVGTTLPKSVWSFRLGVASPSAIEMLLPCKFISFPLASPNQDEIVPSL